MENKIISDEDSKSILEERLLPIWSKKQKDVEEYIEAIEVICQISLFLKLLFESLINNYSQSDFEELSHLVDKELTALFKFLQGATHIWDMHEIGLVKKERALQELLQDCRKDHDLDNQVGY